MPSLWQGLYFKWRGNVMTELQRILKDNYKKQYEHYSKEIEKRTISAIEQYVIKVRIEEKQERADELENIEGCYYNAETQREEIAELKKGLKND